MSKQIIALDIDDVLANNVSEILEWHNKKYNTKFKREDIKTHNFWEVWGGTREQAIQKYFDFIDERGKEMTTIPGSQEAIKKLAESHTLVAVTSRPSELHELTKVWIKNNFGSNISQVYSCNSYAKDGTKETRKSKVIKELNGVLLIDDQSKHAQDCASNNIQVLLLDSPWNKDIGENNFIKRCFSWKEIVTELSVK